MIDLATAQSLPKLLLHDHLDGGLRPNTILEFADVVGHRLPSTDPSELVAYFRRGADAKDLHQYLETFSHTVPLLQTPEHLYRVAQEAAEDLAADGVIYAEVRFAPELHAMALDASIEAVVNGFNDADTGISVNTIVCAMRTEQRSIEVAEACVRWLGRGVVAFDLAGAETGFPPSGHLDAIGIARSGGAQLTLHASEAPGLELISDAIRCGADRIGHGVRLIEDCDMVGGTLELGALATTVLERRIPLELCPSCNVQIGAVPTLADHPIGPFLRAGFVATINTDNRLMSGVSVSSEVADVANAFDMSLGEMRQAQLNAVAACFADETLKAELEHKVLSGF